jgi:heat shock protein HslJ
MMQIKVSHMYGKMYDMGKVTVFSVTLTFVLLGCQYSAMADKTLQDTSWTLTQLNQTRAALAQPAVTLQFSEDSITGFAGCNQFRAQVTYAGSSELNIGPIGSTKKFCEGELMQQEDEFLQNLQSATAYELDSDRLILQYDSGSGAESMVFERVE